ncbi:putative Urease, partial [Hypsibius exemplaris]
NLKEDLAFASSRIRAETIAARNHPTRSGPSSISGSDSVHGQNDNFRIRPLRAKYTINPAIVSGIGHVVGSVEVGKFADLVCGSRSFCAKPAIILKGGQVREYCLVTNGNAHASIPTPEPVRQRKMFEAYGKSPAKIRSCLSRSRGLDKVYGLEKRRYAVRGCTKVTKTDMVLNSATPKLDINPSNYRFAC